jgi:putative phosphoserine phosphatase / 1-acylglycerol-3-phosphate O-acyltransferase
MITAVFDLDRTLLPGTTAERIFLRWLVRNRQLGLSSLKRTLSFLAANPNTGTFHRIRAERPYLQGMHDAVLRVHGRRAVDQKILPSLSERGIEFLLWHQARSHQIVLLSGSLPYVVEPLAEHLGIEHILCSQVELDQLRLTGRLCGLHPYGVAKATLMLEFGQRHDVDFRSSYCYADHHTDEALLDLFGHSVCVNPSERLRQIAIDNDWCIETFC